MSSPNLVLPYLVESQASAEIIYNDALNIIDALLQLSVKDRDLTTPPGSPAQGDRYLVATGGSGDWVSQDGKIAAYYNGWIFITPKEGFSMWVDDENVRLNYDGSVWA